MTLEEKIRLGIAAATGATALILLLTGTVIPLNPLDKIGGVLPL